MFVFTNRRVDGDGDSFDDFRSTIDRDNEDTFKVVRVHNDDGDLSVETLGDSADPASDDDTATWAELALLELAEEMRTEGKNLVIYIHGFSNTLKKSVQRCVEIEKHYGVKTLCISWPTDEKIGFIPGLLMDLQPRYIRDREDAQDSARPVKAMLEVTAKILGEALKDEGSKFTLAAHSMGSFVYQNIIEQFHITGHETFFDNILLLAADCEKANHADWVNEIEVKNKIYITVNVEDRVLAWSRHARSRGHQRLGAYNTGFYKDNPKLEYIDFTAPSLMTRFPEHSYFVNGFKRAKKSKPFFKSAFNGRDAGKEVFDPQGKEGPTHRWRVWPVNRRHV